MKKQQQGFKRNVLKNFIITAMIPLLLLLIFYTAFVWISSKWILERKSEQAGEAIAEKLQQMDSYYKEACMQLAESQELISFLETNEKEEKVFEQYYQSVLDQELKFHLAVVDLKRNMVLKSESRDEYQVDYSFLPLYQMKKEKRQEAVRIFSRVNTDYIRYYYGYGTVVYHDEIPLGYVVYYISNNQMNGILETSGAEEIVITNQFDTVIVTTSESARTALNKLAYTPDGDKNIEVNGTKYYVSVRDLAAEGLRVYTWGNRIYETYILRTLPPFVLMIFVFLMVVLFRLARDMSKRVTEPIETLAAAVQQMGKGVLDVNVEMNTGDEFELLADEYNRMVKKINQLIEKNNQMAEMQRTAEFKMIRNQFNPHFIFNVLETLRYMIFVNQKDAEHMVLALSKFLRYNIYNQDKFVPLKEDMEHMEDFLMLHKARFQERMEYTIIMDAQAGKCFVPKFFIQPFVENSIKYGFCSRDHFRIEIRAELSDKELLVIVKDDGCGMTEEKYNEVCQRLKSDEYPDDHVGLYNINKILQLIYGDEYHLCIYNHEGEGLEIHVRIPERDA